MKKLTLFSIAFLLTLMTAVGIWAGTRIEGEVKEKAIVSEGLQILARQCGMAKSALTGQELHFAPEDFERALNQSRLDYITVVSLPDPALGSLMLGSAAVTAGQTVSRENLHKLSYVEKEKGVFQNQFFFTTGQGYDFSCSLFMRKEANYCPTVAWNSTLATDVTTYRNVSVYGSLSGYDIDGDAITFEVVSYPEHGYLQLTNAAKGTYKYTPSFDYTGKDGFTYVAYDAYGNYSAAATVSLHVEKVTLKSVLSDMGGNRAHAAALTVIEKGVMSPSGAGNQLLFAPGQTVSREDFLVMAMKSVGLDVPSVQQTGFSDDAQISADAKGYVCMAQEKGYLSGVIAEAKEGERSCFYPSRSISTAEAAMIVNQLLKANGKSSEMLGAYAGFSEQEGIPVWAQEAVLTLKTVGILDLSEQGISPERPMTRGDCALLLSSVLQICGK